jgi:DNA polymerase-1
VIATLATRADEAGIKTTVVSTDRDAFQLVRDNVALMMTPRGVRDVHVYTPDAVEARYGITPEQVPDFIGLKGDTSDNIPASRDRRQDRRQLVAQYGSLEEVIAHADELSPARRKNVIEFAEQARARKAARDDAPRLDIDCDPASVVLAPPDRSQLREMFRRFEFRDLLNRVDELDDASRPRADRRRHAVAVARGRAAATSAARRPRDRRRPLRAGAGRRRRVGAWATSSCRARDAHRRARLQGATALTSCRPTTR